MTTPPATPNGNAANSANSPDPVEMLREKNRHRISVGTQVLVAVAMIVGAFATVEGSERSRKGAVQSAELTKQAAIESGKEAAKSGVLAAETTAKAQTTSVVQAFQQDRQAQVDDLRREVYVAYIQALDREMMSELGSESNLVGPGSMVKIVGSKDVWDKVDRLNELAILDHRKEPARGVEYKELLSALILAMQEETQFDAFVDKASSAEAQASSPSG